MLYLWPTCVSPCQNRIEACGLQICDLPFGYVGNGGMLASLGYVGNIRAILGILHLCGAMLTSGGEDELLEELI